MTEASEIVAMAPVDRAIARIRDVYRSWKRDTPVEQMRSDWDTTFEACTVQVSCEPISASGVDAEWIVPANARQDKIILYFHGGGFRLGSVASHRDLISRIADGSGCRVLAALLCLRDSGEPLPVAAVLMSPWTDIAASGESYVSRADTDPIHQRSIILALAKNYLGPDVDPCDSLASPLYAELRGLPPLLIQRSEERRVGKECRL